MKKRTKKFEESINKLKFLKFLKKAETDQKFEETDQQIEIFKILNF